MLAALDLVGIGVFAASGALAAVRARLDVFGVVALGGATGLAGGVVRDLLLGVTRRSRCGRGPISWCPPASRC